LEDPIHGGFPAFSLGQAPARILSPWRSALAFGNPSHGRGRPEPRTFLGVARPARRGPGGSFPSERVSEGDTQEEAPPHRPPASAATVLAPTLPPSSLPPTLPSSSSLSRHRDHRHLRLSFKIYSRLAPRTRPSSPPRFDSYGDETSTGKRLSRFCGRLWRPSTRSPGSANSEVFVCLMSAQVLGHPHRGKLQRRQLKF